VSRAQAIFDRIVSPIQPLSPAGAYNLATRAGDLIFLSGQGPRRPDGSLVIGVVGLDIDQEQAKDAARLCGVSLLTALQQEVGTLDRVAQVVKLTGFIRATPEFSEHPSVLDGCSHLLNEVFEAAVAGHSRSAVGVASLPFRIPIEIEAVVRIET
jgi:enamine deaminase RidA (YjgF/YER057c/UK114 family)